MDLPDIDSNGLDAVPASRHLTVELPGKRSAIVRSINGMNRAFATNGHELNERLEQAGMPQHYHNGYLQTTQDQQLQKQVEQPFWLLVKEAQWKNVSIDMAEAIDRRDTGARNPLFYAAKALESAIKIICELKNWTIGNEKATLATLNVADLSD